jgi:hypothetical protein
MFAGKAGAYLSEALSVAPLLGRLLSSPANIHSTRLERLAGDEHSGILQKYVNYNCKKFYSSGPRVPSHNTLFSS